MLKSTTSIINASQITGVLPVVNGGTGVTTSTGTGNTVLSAAPTLSGNVTLSTGNLIVASGQGIDFSATAGTGTSELLADYEEGTWTAAFTSGGGSITINNSYKTGAYTKIGRQVTVTGYFIVGSVSSPTGNLSVTGLPFAASSASEAFNGSGGLYLTATNAFTGYPFINKQAGTLTFIIQYTDVTGGINAAASLFKAGTEIKISMAYFTD